MKVTLNKHIIILVLILISFQTFAQKKNGSITGKIKTSTDEPVVLADVVLEGTPFGSTTNSNGIFKISNVISGEYILRVSFIGYTSREIKVTVFADSTTRLPDIVIKESPKELQEVIINEIKPGKFKNAESEYVSKLPVKNLENPQSFSSSTEELIKEQNVTDFSSSVRTIPGGVVTSENSIGVLDAYIRGFQTIAYIRNGLYSLSPDGGDIQAIERIEIIKGPSGVVFGAGGVSYGGLLNIVIKKPLANKLISGSLFFGSYNLQRLTTDINLPLNDEKTFLFRLNGAINSQGSFQDYTHKKNYMIAPALSYKLNNNTNVLLEAELNIIDQTPQSYLNGISGLNVNRIDKAGLNYFKSYSTDKTDNSPSISNNYDGKIYFKLSDNWNSDLGFALADFSLHGSVVLLNLLNDSSLTRDFYDYHGQYNTIDIQQNLKGDFQFFVFRNRFLAGIDYKRVEATIGGGITLTADTVNYLKDFIPVLNVENLRSRYNIDISRNEGGNVYSAYVLDFIDITEKLDIMAGLRYEYYDYTGNKNLITGKDITDPYRQGAAAPQAGINYEFLKNKISGFVNFMEGYNFVPPNTIGQSFNPEYASQSEAGFKTNLYGGNISSTISYYYISVRNKVRPDRNHPPFSIQDGTQKSEGIDADIRLNTFQNLNLILGYCFNDSKFLKTSENISGKRPIGTPSNTANLWASYTFINSLKGLGVGAGFRYTGEFYYNDQNTLKIPASFLVNGSLFYSENYYNITLTINNILNKKHWDFNGIPQMLRKIVLSLQISD